jgi:hypothetical protein
MNVSGNIEKKEDDHILEFYPSQLSKTPLSQELHDKIVGTRYQDIGPVDPIRNATLWYDNTRASDAVHDAFWRDRLRRSVAYYVEICLIKSEEGEQMLKTMTSTELDEFLYKLEKANK